MSFSVYRKIANLILLLVASNLSAQVTYYDAAEFQLLGKATAATTERYVRLPDSLEHISRLPLWQLSRNSSGMAVRFRSNSTQVAVKWESLVNFHMDHMTDVAVKGLDLYCLEGKNWYFVNSARPMGKSTESSLISGTGVYDLFTAIRRTGFFVDWNRCWRQYQSARNRKSCT